MRTYHFKEIIKADGSIYLSGLPPYKEVEIVVLYSEVLDWKEELDRWLTDIRSRHPFIKMSKNDILNELKRTREIISSESEKYAD